VKRSLIVQKFGGTSVGTIERIQEVAQQIIRSKDSGHQLVVVVSAMSGETNRLMSLAKQIDNVPTARELDVLLSAGEQVSMALLAMALNQQGYSAVSLTGLQAQIRTNNQHNNATINDIDTSTIEEHLANDQIVIVAGFQGVNDNNEITTLGRGGSDTTAVALAGALKAKECQIFTDVDGVYSCDPRVVTRASRKEVIDFPSMELMASKGAKVLHLPCVQYAWRHNVPLRVLSSFCKGEGTLVTGQEFASPVSGIAIQKSMIMLAFPLSQHELVAKQCQMLGIENECWVFDESSCRLIVKDDDHDKLNLILADRAIEQKKVALLTMVGNNASALSAQSVRILLEVHLSVLHFCEQQHSFTLVMLPDTIDKAANVLHDKYIVTNERLSSGNKQLHLG
jgi:aspartate kinase